MGQRRHYIATDPGPKTGAAIQQAMAATGDPEAMAQLRAMTQEMGQRLTTVEAAARALETAAADLEQIRQASTTEHSRLQAGIDAVNHRVFTLETDQSRQDNDVTGLAAGVQQAKGAAQAAGEVAVLANDRAVTATSTAGRAEQTAGAASTTANQAKATAEGAAQTASQAQSTANSASGQAQTATTTANTAKTTAEEAKTAATAAAARTVQIRTGSISIPILLLGAQVDRTVTWSPALPTSFVWAVSGDSTLLGAVTVTEKSRTATSLTVTVKAGLAAVATSAACTITATALV